MKFKIGEKVRTRWDFKYGGCDGVVLDYNSKGRYLIEFDHDIGSHDLYGKGKKGHCYMIDEKYLYNCSCKTCKVNLKEKKGGVKMSVFDFLLSPDDKLIREKATDDCGNLDLNNVHVQQAILLTIKPQLIKLLRDKKADEKAKKKKKKK